MITVNLLINVAEKLIGFEISGHANYAESGNDIVCAAVSSAAYMVANTITDVIKAEADVCVNNSGKMFLQISEKDISSCFDVLLGFKLHVLSLEKQYPNNIIVNYTEV